MTECGSGGGAVMIVENAHGLFLQRYDGLGERSWRRDDCYKFVFSPYGQSCYQTESGDLVIDKEQFVLFNPTMKHKQWKADEEKFLVEIRPEFLMETARELGYPSESPEFAALPYRQEPVHQWVSFVRSFLKSEGGDSSSLFVENSMVQLAILLLKYGLGSHRHDVVLTQSVDPLNRVMDALKEGYRENWTLGDIAEVARMDKYQLSHLFKRESGVSPYSWLQMYRLFRSQQDLLHTKRSVLTIATEHGFSSIAVYNQLFRRIYHQTPTQFRKRHAFT